MTRLEIITCVIWLSLIAWSLIAPAMGLVSRKEYYCIRVVTDAFGILYNLVCFVDPKNAFDVVFFSCFLTLWIRWFWRDYNLWKNTDDDDEFRKKRRSWVRSHLPRPVITSPVPQKIE